MQAGLKSLHLPVSDPEATPEELVPIRLWRFKAKKLSHRILCGLTIILFVYPDTHAADAAENVYEECRLYSSSRLLTGKHYSFSKTAQCCFILSSSSMSLSFSTLM